MKKDSGAIDKLLFWPPLVLVGIISAAIIANPEASSATANKVFAFLSGPLGWTYQLFVLINFAVVLYFVFGKFANKRFGGDKPEFSTLSWLGMLFSAGTTAAIVYWAPIEFYMYLSEPPFGLEPFSPQAAAMASAYPLLNWGPSSYALYVGIGVVFGYIFFVQGTDVFRPSAACQEFMGEYGGRYVGKAIDVFYMVGIIAGIGTSIGLGTPLLSEVITRITGIPHTLGMDAALLVSWTILVAICVYGGLDKGIRFLSDFRNYLGFGLLAFVLVAGPTSFIFNNFFDSLGVMLTNFFRISLYTDPIQQSGIPQNWTIFYFAWFLSFAISTGMYLARISRGRTVREFTLGATLSGVTCVYTYFAIFGNYTLDLQTRGVINLGEIIKTQGVPGAIVEIFSTLPISFIILPIVLVLLFISNATVINGIAYTLAMVTTAKLGAGEEPAKWNRVFWAVVLGGFSLTLIFLGGMKPLQTSVVASSFPAMFIIGIIVYGFIKKAGKDWNDTQPEPCETPQNFTSGTGTEVPVEPRKGNESC
ncbi:MULTISPECIES: L-carnitine/gamma-butyrobetaine antiporter [Sporomusa]|uniref:L-carnitine/gamma-butyrobetaine antiporter n=1 Tax=Sporomusa TaxID=2375 RepID=UPI00166F0781|nr:MULTISPECIES: L-carnitine/gamma-butyrobetaine antiporter [Sporomusa]MCM0758912.1 L-carnitine/gamma-butyrobetaine antiporter [Sporomusa sphaeroides DSM 2875]HML32430.1 L-carnitine/gamma-butyrobetaine antiporter [Sporomusa sphaeroides]